MEYCRTEWEQEITLQANLQNAQDGVKAFEEALEETRHPMEIQENVLLTILNDNKDTAYGKEYGFSDIHSIEEYQKAVPVSPWSHFDPWVERMLQGEQNVLTAYPFDHFTTTSGTSGKPKHVAYTVQHENNFAKYNSSCGLGLLTKTIGTDWCKGRAFSPTSGEIVTLPSGYTEGHTPAKIVERLGGKENADLTLRAILTSPVEATTLEPGKDTHYIHCRFALEDREVTGINVMYFSWLLNMLEYIDKTYEVLIDDIEKGTISDSISLPEDCRESLLKKIRPMPERAAELREIFKNGPDLPYLPLIWPNLTYIFGTKGGSFATYDRTLRERYTGEGLTRIYYGVTATEGMFSMPVEADCADSVLCPGSLFFEFLPVDANDDFSQIVTMDKVEVGRTYEFIITNFAGLYRYRMSDSAEIVGWYNNTPLIRFVGRVDKSVNVSGEKIPESDIEQVVEKVSKEVNMPIFDFSVYPDYEEKRYCFLVEPLPDTNLVLHIFANKLQKEMENNSEKYLVLTHHMKALNPLSVQKLQRFTCLLQTEIQEYKGASMNTIKPVHVIAKEKQQKFFTKMVEGPVCIASLSSAEKDAVEIPAEKGTVVFPIEGFIDAEAAPELEERLDAVLKDADFLVLDLSNLDYISSAGLRVILKAQKTMSAKGGMKVIHVNDNIMEIFEAVGFDEILDIER